MQKTAALRAAVFSLFAKNLRGGGRLDAPPGPARVNPAFTYRKFHVDICHSILLRKIAIGPPSPF